MALELKQQLKLTQQLVMTPQLQQAIKLLQLSRLELVETVRQEMESNPVLEEETFEIAEGEDSTAKEKPEKETNQPLEEVVMKEEPPEDFDWESYIEEYSTGSPAIVENEYFKELPPLENRLVKKASLDSHLMWQLRLSNFTEEERNIGAIIIGNLNSDGYLKASVEEIAEMAESDVETVEKVLERIQEFDPVGVAARDLKECLLIQARKLDPPNELVVEIITNQLHDLENKNYYAISKALKRPPEEIEKAINIITNLDPRPGLAYNDEEVQYISPDIYVFKVDDEFVVVLNEDGLPKLKISSFYKDALKKDGNFSDFTKDYIQEKLRSASWLIKSIHQRQRTIYKVAKSIVKFQREFFEKGITHLKPMVLRDVAEDVNMHESTISRVTTNKYMHTPQGIFELKFFFNSSINSVIGDSVASESVKEMIRRIIQSENPEKPYSDKKIVELLREQNIKIARRTVAKYREIMGILPSSKRKKAVWKNLKKKKK